MEDDSKLGWKKLADMDRESIENHVISLRAKVSQHKNHLDRYRMIVSGVRGALKALEAALYCPMPGWPEENKSSDSPPSPGTAITVQQTCIVARTKTAGRLVYSVMKITKNGVYEEYSRTFEMAQALELSSAMNSGGIHEEVLDN